MFHVAFFCVILHVFRLVDSWCLQYVDRRFNYATRAIASSLFCLCMVYNTCTFLLACFFSKLMLHEKQTNRLGLISNHLPDFDTMSRGLFVLSVPFELQFQFSLLVVALYFCLCLWRWLGSRVVRVLDSVAEGPGFKSQPRRCRVTVLDKLFTPIVPLFTRQQNW